MAFTFLWSEGSFVARDVGGSSPDVLLEFPDDFPGHPALALDLEAEIESVWLRIIASSAVATRRARIQLLTGSALVQAQAVSNATVAAGQTRQFQFIPGGTVAQGGTLLNVEPMPVMVMGQPWSLSIDIQAADSADLIESVCVQGRFRPGRRVGTSLYSP